MQTAAVLLALAGSVAAQAGLPSDIAGYIGSLQQNPTAAAAVNGFITNSNVLGAIAAVTQSGGPGALNGLATAVGAAISSEPTSLQPLAQSIFAVLGQQGLTDGLLQTVPPASASNLVSSALGGASSAAGSAASQASSASGSVRSGASSVASAASGSAASAMSGAQSSASAAVSSASGAASSIASSASSAASAGANSASSRAASASPTSNPGSINAVGASGAFFAAAMGLLGYL